MLPFSNCKAEESLRRSRRWREGFLQPRPYRYVRLHRCGPRRALGPRKCMAARCREPAGAVVSVRCLVMGITSTSTHRMDKALDNPLFQLGTKEKARPIVGPWHPLAPRRGKRGAPTRDSCSVGGRTPKGQRRSGRGGFDFRRITRTGRTRAHPGGPCPCRPGWPCPREARAWPGAAASRPCSGPR